jgi:hypothetical protein
MSEPIANETIAAYQQLQGRFAEATAEIGGQVEWPPEGTHNAYIIGLNCKTGEFRQSDGQTFPSVTTQFVYELMEDPDRASPLQWPGALFNLPLDAGQLSVEGSQRRAEIEMNRLKGFLKVLKGGEEPGEIAAEIQLIKSQIDAPDTTLAVQVRCQYRKANNGQTYRTDFVKELLSGAATPAA